MRLKDVIRQGLKPPPQIEVLKIEELKLSNLEHELQIRIQNPNPT
jgi:LEA14-like dessication related protein